MDEGISDNHNQADGQSGAAQRVDMHCHCLPDIDDGPATLADALELCRLLVVDGITTVIATPHQLGRYGRANTAERIHQSVTKLRDDLRKNNINLDVLPGAEVRIDERLLASVEVGELLTLAGENKYLLLELPKHTFIDPTPVIKQFEARKTRVIVAHPERQHRAMKSPELAGEWFASGGILQVTAGSLLGDFGNECESSAWAMLESNWVQLIASDAHSANKRPPRMSAAMAAITERLGQEMTTRLCIDNPLRVARGLELIGPHSAGRSHRNPRGGSQENPLQSWARDMQAHARGPATKRQSSLTGLFRWFRAAPGAEFKRARQTASPRRKTLE